MPSQPNPASSLPSQPGSVVSQLQIFTDRPDTAPQRNQSAADSVSPYPALASTE